MHIENYTHTNSNIPDFLISGAKFIRRFDLTSDIRLYIAFTALRAMMSGSRGIVTNLAREYLISRTFVYMLASTLDQTNQIIFGKNSTLYTDNDIKRSFSCMLSLRLEGRCSLDAAATIMGRFDQGPFAASTISQHLNYFGSVVPDTLSSNDNEVKKVIFASDEIFARRIPILITVDTNSSAILKAELSDTRKSEDWQNHWECIMNNGYIPVYVVSDEGIGLCAAHRKTLPELIRQTDTYHAIAHQLGQWVNRLENIAYGAITAEDNRYKTLDSAKSNAVFDKRFCKWENAYKHAEKKVELYDSFCFLYHSLLNELQIFDATGNLRDRKASEENIEAALDLIETMGNVSLRKASGKVRRILPGLLNYFDVARDVVAELQTQGIDNEALCSLCLAWQWSKGVVKAKKTERRHYCAEKEQLCLEFAMGLLQESYENVKEQVYEALDHIVQSSAIVECINSLIRPYLNNSKNHITQETLNLIVFYLNHRRYKAGKRKGTTPREILTGKKQKKIGLSFCSISLKKKILCFFLLVSNIQLSKKLPQW